MENAVRKVDIPSEVEGLTATWLTAAFNLKFPGTIVDSALHELRIAGAGTKVRLRLSYTSNPHDLPSVVWAKGGWEPHSASARAMGIYAREAQFYSEWASLISIKAPASYFSAWQGDGDGLVLMEDIPYSGGTMWDGRVTRSVDDVASLIDSLASLHALRWRDPTLAEDNRVSLPVCSTGPLSEWAIANGGERVRQIMAGPRAEGLPQSVRDGGRIEAAFWKMVRQVEAGTDYCLLHADPHPGNCYTTADGAAGLYDWQTLSRGPWAHDISYSVVTALEPADRRIAERDLLIHYLDCLNKHGCRQVPKFTDAWDEYRRYIAMPLFIWPTNHVSHQPEDVIRALTFRLGMAAADFDFFSLWDV